MSKKFIIEAKFEIKSISNQNNIALIPNYANITGNFVLPRNLIIYFSSSDDATPSIECKMPLGYRFICKTQYMTIRLVVYEDDNRLGVESFSIPAGCSCTYEYA